MKKILFIVFFAATVLGASAQMTAYKDQFPSIEVRGVAERKIEPNRVEVNVRLSEAPSKGKLKIKELESQLAKVLTQAEIDPKSQLVVVSASSTGQKRSGAYQYKSYRVTVHSVEQLSSLFDALASTDIVDASVGKMDHSDHAKIQQELQVEAMHNSREVAANLAAAIGQGIGQAVSIQYWNNSPSPIYNNELLRVSSKSVRFEESAASGLPSDVGMKMIELRVDVTVSYELKGKTKTK